MTNSELPKSFMFRGKRTPGETDLITLDTMTNPNKEVHRIHIDAEFGGIVALEPFPLNRDTTPDQLAQIRADIQREHCIVVTRHETSTS